MTTLKRNKYVVIGTLMLIFLGTIYAWSYFKSAISLEFPTWNDKQLSLNFTIMMICFGLGGFAGGSLSKRYSRKYLAMISGGLLFIGFMVMSFLPADNPSLALILMYIFYGGFTGFGVGIGYNVILAGVNSWFPDKDGFVSGVLLTGFGLGSLILGNIADLMMNYISLYATFRSLGIGCAVIVIGGATLLKFPTADTPLPAPRQKTAISGGKDYTTKEMLSRPTFWIYFLWNLCMSATGLLVINNAASISIYFGVAATVGLLVSIFNSGGRLILGMCMDKFGWKATMFIANGTIIASGVLMVLGNSVSIFPLVLLGMLMAGVCYGGGVAIQASLVRTFYGNENYPVNFSVCNLVAIPAAIIGPMISAALVDAAGGAFGHTFIMVIIMGLLSLVLNFMVRKP